jgi:V8-like Glu-specific endopeptidase
MRRIVMAVLAAAALSGSSMATAHGNEVGASADARGEHQRIVDYWTPARRARAVPRDLVLPMAKPGGGGQPSSGSVTGARWTGGGSVALTTGKVFFTLDGIRYVCSGSAVSSAHGSLVLTAGHCVHHGGSGAFATNWVFYPGYNSGPHPTLGAWTATDLFTTTAWATSPNAYGDDAGLAAVIGGGGTLTGALGALGATVPSVAFSLATHTDSNYAAFGYPAARKYSGATLTYCAGPVRESYDGQSSLALACDMTGGSSGGPWLRGFDATTGTGTINSVVSYGYASLKNVLFGPIFDGAEQAVYSSASTAADCDPAAAGFRCADLSDG